jgi:hypothetical protein
MCGGYFYINVIFRVAEKKGLENSIMACGIVERKMREAIEFIEK